MISYRTTTLQHLPPPAFALASWAIPASTPRHPTAPRARQEHDGTVTPPMLYRSECFAEDLLETPVSC